MDAANTSLQQFFHGIAGGFDRLKIGFNDLSLTVCDEDGVNVLFKQVMVVLTGGTGLLEEGGVLDGDAGNIGDGLLQRNIISGEEVCLRMDDGEHAHQFFVGHHRHAQSRFAAGLRVLTGFL
ncbi:hypothetical protein SDC9_186641 [bioreactor metagenome]|uniref:Uncharacterized protein n=1 Tax=bioreactor metagenome TaxID=1076179 RepID=A0A645HSI4_9ZZZZ